jgi:hypothetical protein
MAVAFLGGSPVRADDYKAGVARVVITPEPGLWMAGYAGRNKPAEGKVHDLFAKALALEDAKGQRLVLVTTDLLGLPRSMSVPVAEEVEKKTGLPRANLMLTSSHTHCGPVLRDNLLDMYDMPPDQKPKLAAYSEELRTKLVDVVVAALKDLKPAKLALGKGTARFAVNRRQQTDKGIILGVNPEGPVDHDVPVLQVIGADGKLRAVVFGYACHNTTLDFYQWCGDYAGFAQAEFEAKHPGVQAMFWIGCGGDANPNPRRTLELAEKHGKELADAVDAAVGQPLPLVSGSFSAKYELISLPFGKLPTREQWMADVLSKTRAVRVRAERMLKTLDSGGKIDDHYPNYPLQVWRLGDQVTWIALGGEVVIDYNLRIKKELGEPGASATGGRALWITGYANDVMCYISSARVISEGGYEPDFSMVYYGMPTKWSPEIEDKIIAKVRELVGK